MADNENILSESPLLEAQQNAPQLYASPFTRLLGAGAYGLSLGGGGIAPETVPEHVAEFVGSVPTFMGMSAVATPAVAAAARVARLKPLGKLAMGAASNLAVDVPTAAIESYTKDRNFAENLAWNVGASATGMGILHGIGGRAKTADDNLQALAKATTTKVPEVPSVATGGDNVLKIDESQVPTSATVGPNIGRNRNVMDPKRIHMTDYTDLYDEYGRPVSMSPETRLSAATTQVDEYGAPRQVETQLSPEQYARETAPQGIDLQARRASEMLNAIRPAGTVGEQPFVAPTPNISGTKPFKATFDPRLNTFVMTPTTQQADEAVNFLSKLESPRNIEMQLSPAQQAHIADPQAAIRKEIERLAKENDALRTSKLVNKPEEEVETIVQTATPPKAMDVVTLKETKAGQTVDELILKNNIPQERVLAIVKEAELENSKTPFKSEAQRLTSLSMRILNAIRKECGV